MGFDLLRQLFGKKRADELREAAKPIGDPLKQLSRSAVEKPLNELETALQLEIDRLKKQINRLPIEPDERTYITQRLNELRTGITIEKAKFLDRVF